VIIPEPLEDAITHTHTYTNHTLEHESGLGGGTEGELRVTDRRATWESTYTSRRK